MVHRGALVELRDRGQDAEGIGREEDDHVGDALGATLEHGVVDVLDGVGDAAVLGEADVVVVGDAGVGVDGDVLADRAKANGVPNLRLGLALDVDGLGVAAALDVEDRLLRPAVLVVADEHAVLGGGERRLAGAGEAEEDRGAVRTGVHVAGAVHRENIILDGEKVVHHGEDGLLDLARILGADDENDALLEVDEDSGLGVRAVNLRVELELGCRHHHEVRSAEVPELLLGGTHEHLADEERLARHLADCEDLAREVTVGAGDAMDHVEPALGEVRDDLVLDALIALLGERDVDGPPGDLVMHVRRVHDEAVVRRAAGVGPRGHGEAAGAGKDTLIMVERHLDELGGRAVDRGLLVRVGDSVLSKLLDDHEVPPGVIERHLIRI